MLYVAIVQAVLLYGSKTWGVPPYIGRTLCGFRHRVACRLTVWKPQRGLDGRWVYPLLVEVIAESGLQEVETYISCCQNTVALYIATKPIMTLCLVTEIRLEIMGYKRWWEQEGL